MGAKPAVGPKCLTGGCTCVPACDPQAERVQAFLTSNRERQSSGVDRLSDETRTAPKGHVWLCAACATVQPAPGTHCGYRIILVEAKRLDKTPSGRVTAATSAQIPSLYRKAPPGSLGDWKPSGGQS